jgi:hypothetical protein
MTEGQMGRRARDIWAVLIGATAAIVVVWAAFSTLPLSEVSSTIEFVGETWGVDEPKCQSARLVLARSAILVLLAGTAGAVLGWLVSGARWKRAFVGAEA